MKPGAFLSQTAEAALQSHAQHCRSNELRLRSAKTNQRPCEPSHPSQFLRTFRVGSSSQSNKSHYYAISKHLIKGLKARATVQRMHPGRTQGVFQTLPYINQTFWFSSSGLFVTQSRYSYCEHNISTTIRNPRCTTTECLSGRAWDQSNMGCKRFFKRCVKGVSFC